MSRLNSLHAGTYTVEHAEYACRDLKTRLECYLHASCVMCFIAHGMHGKVHFRRNCTVLESVGLETCELTVLLHASNGCTSKHSASRQGKRALP